MRTPEVPQTRIQVAGDTVRVVGDVGPDTAAALRAALEAAHANTFARAHPVRVDLTAVSHFDSRAAGALIALSERLHLLLAPGSPVARVLDMCGLLALPGVTVDHPTRGPARNRPSRHR